MRMTAAVSSASWEQLFERLDAARQLNARKKWSQAQTRYLKILEELTALAGGDLEREHRERWNELAVRVYVGLSNSVLALTNSLGESMALCDRAEEVARLAHDGALISVVLGQRGVLQMWTGQPAKALVNLSGAIAVPGVTDHRDLAMYHLNRGNAYSELGDFTGALTDYEVAYEHSVALENDQFISFSLHNIGYARYTLGDLPGALADMDRARTYAPDQDDGIPELGRAEVLYEGGLLDDAEQLLATAAERLARSALQLDHAEAEWFRARCLIGLHRFDEARSQAAQAHQRFERGGQQSMAALAMTLELEAALSAVSWGRAVTRSTARRRAAQALAVARKGDTAGPVLGQHPGHAARLVAARWLMQANDLDAARAVLAELPRVLTSASLTIRIQHYTAQAELAFTTGDRTKGLRAVHAGLSLLADHRSKLGAVESVTAAAVHGADLTRLDVRAAARTGRPAALFDALERAHATFAGAGRVTPPEDPKAAALLTEARGLLAKARDLGAADARARENLTRRAARLQDEVRQRSWRHAGNAGAVQRPVASKELRTVLGRRPDDTTVVANFLVEDGVLRCVRVDAQGVTSCDIGPEKAVTESVRRLSADFAMAANDLIPAPLRAAARASLKRNLKTLDDLVLDPLSARGDLYILARDPLLSVPWSALPSRSGLRTAVNSHLGRGRAYARPRGKRHLLAAAGPGVEHGTAEAHAVGRQWPGATVLTGKDAVTERVRTALATHDVVHLATHGQHDADNPLFASIDLADGPLFAHELDGTPLPGSVVILSSCEVGGSTQVLGGEVLGLTSVLLRLGARAVIASVAKLSDELAARVMPRLHAYLRDTDDPEAALAAALKDVAEPAPLVCFSSVEGLAAR